MKYKKRISESAFSFKLPKLVINAKAIPFLVLIFCFSFTRVCDAQPPTTFELGIQYTPAVSNIYGELPHLNQFDPLLTHSGGIKFNILVSKFIVNFGVLHLTQGAQTQITVTTVDQPAGTGEFANAKTTYSHLIIPALINYSYFKNKKINLYAGGGLHFGVRYNQTVNVDDTYIRFQGKRNYLALNIGTGIKLNISPKWNFEFRANALNQLTDIGTQFKSRAYSVGLDAGINFVFPSKSNKTADIQ